MTVKIVVSPLQEVPIDISDYSIFCSIYNSFEFIVIHSAGKVPIGGISREIHIELRGKKSVQYFFRILLNNNKLE